MGLKRFLARFAEHMPISERNRIAATPRNDVDKKYLKHAGVVVSQLTAERKLDLQLRLRAMNRRPREHLDEINVVKDSLCESKDYHALWLKAFKND